MCEYKLFIHKNNVEECFRDSNDISDGVTRLNIFARFMHVVYRTAIQYKYSGISVHELFDSQSNEPIIKVFYEYHEDFIVKVDIIFYDPTLYATWNSTSEFPTNYSHTYTTAFHKHFDKFYDKNKITYKRNNASMETSLKKSYRKHWTILDEE